MSRSGPDGHEIFRLPLPAVVTVVVDAEPYEAGFDPYTTLIDRLSADNRRRVSMQ